MVFQPHYWQTWWSKLAIPTAITLALIAWYRSRVTRLQEIERLRVQIAADLHDDVGARLTKVAMVTEWVDHETDAGDRNKENIVSIARTTREVIQAMDEIVWTIDPKNDTLDNLANYIFQHAQDYFQNTVVKCRLDVPTRLPEYPLSTEQRHNLFMAVKEALNNVLKHAQATEVKIGLAVVADKLTIVITDNGRGFVCGEQAAGGNGLENMRQRLQQIRGRLTLESKPGAGTRVEMEAPLD
jgi:signal transduction histidine kinase